MLLVATCHVLAGEKLKEGKLKFEITMPEAEGMSDQMLAMMPKEMTLYFKGDKSRSEMMMMGTTMISISDKKADETITYMDIMGKKTAIRTTAEDAEKEKAALGEYEVKITDESKIIAGYNCKKAIVHMKKDDQTMDVWFTDELEVANSTKYTWKGIDGFMMEFFITQGKMQMKFTCTQVKKESVSDDMFKAPEGYTVMTPEELKKMYGGAGAH